MYTRGYEALLGYSPLYTPLFMLSLSATACMSGDLRVLLALSPYTRTREALTRATTGHGAAAISVNCTDAWTIYLPTYLLSSCIPSLLNSSVMVLMALLQSAACPVVPPVIVYGRPPLYLPQ